jgi:hypothetical protein
LVGEGRTWGSAGRHRCPMSETELQPRYPPTPWEQSTCINRRIGASSADNWRLRVMIHVPTPQTPHYVSPRQGLGSSASKPDRRTPSQIVIREKLPRNIGKFPRPIDTVETEFSVQIFERLSARTSARGIWGPHRAPATHFVGRPARCENGCS